MARILSNSNKKYALITLHPVLKNTFNFLHEQAYLFDKTMLSKDAFRTLNSYTTLHVIKAEKPSLLDSKSKKRKPEFFLFSGFESVCFNLKQMDINQSIIVIHDKISDEDILSFCWANIMRSLLTSLDSRELEKFRQEFNQSAPDHFIHSFCQKGKLSQNYLSHISSLSRGALAKQNNRSSENRQPDEPSIFELLKQVNQNESC